MTPESQRIAIAQACGWEEVTLQEWEKRLLRATPPFNYFRNSREPPDYLNDLNAMHEAEKVLKPEQNGGYDKELRKLCAIHNSQPPYIASFEWHASAAQRAEAFLRTLGLWVEEPASEATVEGLR